MASLSIGAAPSLAACNDSAASQYWHWGAGQIYPEQDKSLCLALMGAMLWLQPCSSADTQWDYQNGQVINTASSLCLQGNGLGSALSAATCAADNANQQFALGHAKITRLVGSTSNTVLPADSMVVHGMAVESAQDYNCLTSLMPDSQMQVALLTGPCNGGATQQWVLNGNRLQQGNSCLAGIPGDTVHFLLQDCVNPNAAVWHYSAGAIVNDTFPTPCLEFNQTNVVRAACTGVTPESWYLGGN